MAVIRSSKIEKKIMMYKGGTITKTIFKRERERERERERRLV